MLAFTITGTVAAESLDEARVAICDYIDPRNDAPELDDATPIGDFRVDWREHAPEHS